MKNPIRRSKKIGLTQGGRVMNGRPEEKWSRMGFHHNIYSKISESDELWKVYKQNPSRDYFHPCEGDEYIEVLKALPEEVTKYVKGIILPKLSKVDRKYLIDAKRRYDCIILNPFPRTMELDWGSKPAKSTFRHYDPWCQNWKQSGRKWILKWTKPEIKKYFKYHLFLHELGHINEPWFHSRRKREEFAENFALEWARKLGKL